VFLEVRWRFAPEDEEWRALVGVLDGVVVEAIARYLYVFGEVVIGRPLFKRYSAAIVE
jgi:hypothetical protein